MQELFTKSRPEQLVKLELPEQFELAPQELLKPQQVLVLEQFIVDYHLSFLAFCPFQTMLWLWPQQLFTWLIVNQFLTYLLSRHRPYQIPS